LPQHKRFLSRNKLNHLCKAYAPAYSNSLTLIPGIIMTTFSVSNGERQRAVQAALGNTPFDLLLSNANLIDMVTGEILVAPCQRHIGHKTWREPTSALV